MAQVDPKPPLCRHWRTEVSPGMVRTEPFRRCQKWIVPFVISLQMPSWHHWIEIETDRLNDNRALASGGSNTLGRTGSDTANGVHAGHRDGKRRIEYRPSPSNPVFKNLLRSRSTPPASHSVFGAAPTIANMFPIACVSVSAVWRLTQVTSRNEGFKQYASQPFLKGSLESAISPNEHVSDFNRDPGWKLSSEIYQWLE